MSPSTALVALALANSVVALSIALSARRHRLRAEAAARQARAHRIQAELSAERARKAAEAWQEQRVVVRADGDPAAIGAEVGRIVRQSRHDRGI